MTFSRKLGFNIFVLMKNKQITVEELASKLEYSVRDVHRVLEGCLFLPPKEMERIADVFGMTKKELMDYNYTLEELPEELEYINKFSNPENLDLILDLIDMYVNLQEAV